MILTKTQREILVHLAEGWRQEEIAMSWDKHPHLIAQHIHKARVANDMKTTNELMYWFGKHEGKL